MKLLSKFLCTLLILLALATVLAYALLQTPTGAGWLSEQLSRRSGYQITFTGIQHSPFNPAEIRLREVRLSRAGEPLLDAGAVTLRLSWYTLTHPRQWQQIRLQDGELRLPAVLQPQNYPPLQARQLLLQNMALTTPLDGRLLVAHPVSGGITPFIPGPGGWLGDDSRFEFSAQSLTYGELELQRMLLRGRWQQGKLLLQDFGADMLQGQVSGRGERSRDGQWSLRDLRLTRLRLQDNRLPRVLRHLWQRLPVLTIHNVDLVDARLEGNDWSANDLDLSAENLQLGQGQLHSRDGLLSLNALDLVYRDVHLRDPVLKLTFTPDGITVDDASTRFENGLLRTYGRWNAAQRSLQLDEVGISGMEYTLPERWLHWLGQPLPAWLQQLNVLRLDLNNNLLVDIRPRFPFQFTALGASGSNLQLIRNQQWGLWQGSLRLNARDATLNKVDLRHLLLDLQAQDGTVTLHELSAFGGQGLWEGSGTLQASASSPASPSAPQSGAWPFTLTLTGQQVGLDSLQRWGWSALPLRGFGNINLSLHSTLFAPAQGLRSLTGQLNVSAEQAMLQNTAAAGLFAEAKAGDNPRRWLDLSQQEGQMTLLRNLQLRLRAAGGMVNIEQASAAGQLPFTLSGHYARAVSTPDAATRTQLQLTLTNPSLCEILTRRWQSDPQTAPQASDNASAGSHQAPPSRQRQLHSSVDVTPLPVCGPQPAGSTK